MGQVKLLILSYLLPFAIAKNQSSHPMSQSSSEPHPYECSDKEKYAPPQRPPEFWDNLSKLWLTRKALRELDRRNASPLSNLRYNLDTHRPATRFHPAEKKRKHSVLYAPYFLNGCDTQTLKKLKQFAKAGGPDMSDLCEVTLQILSRFRGRGVH